MLKYFNIQFLLIFLLIIWSPFQIFVLKVDSAGRILVGMSFLVLFLSIWKGQFMEFVWAKPNRYWLIWILFSFFNALIFEWYSEEPPLFFLMALVYPFLGMSIVNRFIKKPDLITNVVIVSFAVYLFLVIIFFRGNLTAGERVDQLLNVNIIGIHCLVLVFFLMLKHQRKHINFILFIILILVPIIIIVLTASRKSFIGLVILSTAYIFTKLKGNILKKILILGFGPIFLYSAFIFFLEDTQLGKRLLETTDQVENENLIQTGTFLDKMGDRGIYYYYGWKVFKSNPITGVSLRGFIYNSPLEDANHSEYMTQLSEGGIIGTALFLMFYIWIGKGLYRIWRKHKKNRKTTILYVGIFLAILSINLSAWTYHMVPIFLCFGMIINYIQILNKPKKILVKKLSYE